MTCLAFALGFAVAGVLAFVFFKWISQEVKLPW